MFCWEEAGAGAPTEEDWIWAYKKKTEAQPEAAAQEPAEEKGTGFAERMVSKAAGIVEEASKPPAIHPGLPAAAKQAATNLAKRVAEGATAAELQLEMEELGKMGLDRIDIDLIMQDLDVVPWWDFEEGAERGFDYSPEWRPPEKEEPKGVLDILGETVGAPLAKAAERFVPTPEKIAAAGKRSPEEERMFGQMDLTSQIRRLQKDPTATEGPGSFPRAEDYDEWIGAKEQLARFTMPKLSPIEEQVTGQYGIADTFLGGVEALTPQFAQDIVYDVGQELTGEGAETTAQLRSPIMRLGAEYIYDNLIRDESDEERSARAWARGDVPQPGEGIAKNLAVDNPILTKQQRAQLAISVPPEEEPGYLQGAGIWAGTVAGRAEELVGGAVFEAGSELDKFQERMKMNQATHIRQKALRARKEGKTKIQLPFHWLAVDVDTVLEDHNEQQAADDWARLTDLRSKISEAHDRLNDRLTEKLKDSPGLFSWYTVKNWREAVGELASGLGGLLLYAGGMTKMPDKLELDARGRYVVGVEDFWDAYSATKAVDDLLGGTLATEAIAGFAINTHPATILSALEVDGPVALLDVVPYFAYVKAGAVAGKIKLPASALKKIDYLLELTEPMADYLGEPYHQLRRYVAESGSNVERLATEGYDLITRNTREEQAAVDNALKQVARMVEEGFELGLGERAEPFKTVEGPKGEKLELFPEEQRAFDENVERIVREEVEARWRSRGSGHGPRRGGHAGGRPYLRRGRHNG